MNKKLDLVLVLLATVIFIVWMLFPVQACAQTIVTFKLMPPGHDGQVEGVGRARYYLLEEYLQLAQFDSELVKLRMDVETLRGVNKALTDQLVAQGAVIKSLLGDVELWRGKSNRIEDRWKQCEADLVSTSSPPLWSYIVAIIGGVVGLGGVAYAIGTKYSK